MRFFFSCDIFAYPKLNLMKTLHSTLSSFPLPSLFELTTSCRQLPRQLEAEGREVAKERDVLGNKKRLLEEASFRDKVTRLLTVGLKTTLAVFGATDAVTSGEAVSVIRELGELGGELGSDGDGLLAGPEGNAEYGILIGRCRCGHIAAFSRARSQSVM